MSGSGCGQGLAASMADVEDAMKRIRGHIHYTPILQNSYLNSVTGLQLFFKCELFQKTGSFKVGRLVQMCSMECDNHFQIAHDNTPTILLVDSR